MPVYLRSVSVADVDGDMAAGVTAKTLDCLSRLAARRRHHLLRKTLCLFGITMSIIGAWYLWTNGVSQILPADSIGPRITVLEPPPGLAVRPGRILVRG